MKSRCCWLRTRCVAYSASSRTLILNVYLLVILGVETQPRSRDATCTSNSFPEETGKLCRYANICEGSKSHTIKSSVCWNVCAAPGCSRAGMWDVKVRVGGKVSILCSQSSYQRCEWSSWNLIWPWPSPGTCWGHFEKQASVHDQTLSLSLTRTCTHTHKSRYRMSTVNRGIELS